MKTIHAFTPAERATILAALMHYERDMRAGFDLSAVGNLAAAGGLVEPLDAAQVEDLSVQLADSPLTFADVVRLRGVGTDDPYVAIAVDHPMLEEGGLELDLPTISNETEAGAYIMTWLWVPNPADDGEGDDE